MDLRFDDWRKYYYKRCPCCGKPIRPQIGEVVYRDADLILDPMSGSGTVMLGCQVGRDVCCVELESKFVLMMQGGDCDGWKCVDCQLREEWQGVASEDEFLELADKHFPKDKQLELAFTALGWKHTKRLILHRYPRAEPHRVTGNWERVQAWGPQMGCEMGDCKIICGDARDLEGVLADAVIGSPPYGEAIQKLPNNYHIPITGSPLSKGTDAVKLARYSDSKDNISNLPYGSIDVVAGSPPYQEADVQRPGKAKSVKNYQYGSKQKHQGQSPNNIANLFERRYGDIDVIAGSPPYGGSEARDRSKEDWWNEEREKKFSGGSAKIAKGYKTDNINNIGNLKYGDIDVIAGSKFVDNANKCYNIGKCRLEFILEPKKHKENELKLCEQSGLQAGQTRCESLAAANETTVLIVGLKLIEEQSVANPVPQNTLYIRSYPKKVREGLEKAILSIRECLAKDTQFNQELKCLSTDFKVENLERLLTNAIITQLNGKNGEDKSLNEISMPADFVAQKLQKEKGRLYILSHITLSQLLNNPNLSLRCQTELPSAENAITKPKDKKTSSPTYLSEMLKVYKSAFKVLKPGGLMIMVVKPYIRDFAIVPLQEHTKTLLGKAGFVFLEEHYRRLTQQSFWRTLYRQKYPDAPIIDKEYIEVFQK